MNAIFDTYKPTGFRTVNPYLFADNPQELLDFLTGAFFAKEINRTVNPKDGTIANCIVNIGDTNFMISQARPPFDGMRTSFYLYVNDVDKVHQLALDRGAREVLKAMDMDYGDRQSGVIDPAGNYWWISQRLEETDYAE